MAKSKEDIINFVVERGETARAPLAKLYTKFTRWYDFYRGYYASKGDAIRNFLHIPFALSIIQSDVARKVQTSFGVYPFIQFVGAPRESANIARKNEIVVTEQMKDAHIIEVMYDFFLMADLYGTSFLRTGWKNDVRKMRRRAIDPVSGNEQQVDGDVTFFDGPDCDVLDPQDFWPQMNKRRWTDCKYGTHRYYLDIDQIKGMEASGLVDKGTVKALGDGPSTHVADDADRYGQYRSWFNNQQKEPFTTQIEVWEYNGEVPEEYAEDGFLTRRILVLNRNTLAVNDPYPFWHGDIHKQFISYSPMPDPHYLWGTGKMEIIEKPQAAVDKLGSMKLDILEMFASPGFFYNDQAGIDLSNMTMRPGRGIPISGPVDESNIRPISPDLRGVQSLYGEIGSLWGFMQQGAGISEDTVMGMQGQGRQTAREFQGRQEAVLTRLMLEARLAESGAVEPLGDTFAALNRQYLKAPHRRAILGKMEEINPITGLPENPDDVELSLEEINHTYQARAMGATHMLGKAVQQQNAIALLQATASHPVGMQVVNWANFFRQLFDLFDFKNSDELLVQNVPAVNQMAQQNGGQVPQNPGDLLGTGDGMNMMEQMGPDLMGRQDLGLENQPLPMEAM